MDECFTKFTMITTIFHCATQSAYEHSFRPENSHASGFLSGELAWLIISRSEVILIDVLPRADFAGKKLAIFGISIMCSWNGGWIYLSNSTGQ